MGQTTVTGNLAEDPKEVTTGGGTALTVFRLVENQRVYDRQQQHWVDGEPVGYDVAIRQERLRRHALNALHRGDRVTVTGEYQVSPYVHKRTREPGLNRRIAARDVSISMFDDRFDQPRADKEIDRQIEQSARVDGLTTAASQKASELDQRRPLTGKGTAAPPGPPQSVATVEFGEPTATQQQEVQARQQQAHASWAAMEQQHPRPGL